MPQLTREHMLAELTRTRAELLDVLGRVPDDHFDRPQTFNQWSLKDVLAHLVNWDRLTIQGLDLVLQGRAHEIPVPDTEKINAINTRAVARRRPVTRAQVMEDLQRTRRELLAWVERLTDAQIADESAPFPVRRWLPLVYQHEGEDHLPKIRAWEAAIPGMR